MPTELTLPDVPRSDMFDVRTGTMSRVWQNFFRSLFIRVGEFSELSNTELSELIGYGSLAANRLVATDSDKFLSSVLLLSSWIAGTANQVTVSDNVDGDGDNDGTITLSLPDDVSISNSITVPTGNVKEIIIPVDGSGNADISGSSTSQGAGKMTIEDGEWKFYLYDTVAGDFVHVGGFYA